MQMHRPAHSHIVSPQHPLLVAAAAATGRCSSCEDIHAECSNSQHPQHPVMCVSLHLRSYVREACDTAGIWVMGSTRFSPLRLRG